jgi:ABC-type branched-subunit amino acid transport system substrate-binding protein
LLLDLPREQQKALMEAFGKITPRPSSSTSAKAATSCVAHPATPHWLHTLPSDRMLADAMAQWLAARNWRDMILLVGSKPEDQTLRDIWMASVKRYGLKVKAERKFVLSAIRANARRATPSCSPPNLHTTWSW